MTSAPQWCWKALPALRLPSLLLLLVAVTHYTYDPIGSLYVGREIQAATAWFGVLRAFEATALWLVVWYLVPWKPVVRRIAAALGCLWGVFESSQIAICRLQFQMDRRPPKDPQLYSGMCDLVTGWPIYTLTLLAVLLVAALRWHNARRRAK